MFGLLDEFLRQLDDAALSQEDRTATKAVGNIFCTPKFKCPRLDVFALFRNMHLLYMSLESKVDINFHSKCKWNWSYFFDHDYKRSQLVCEIGLVEPEKFSFKCTHAVTGDCGLLDSKIDFDKQHPFAGLNPKTKEKTGNCCTRT